jgi:CRISPR type I-E-associated protein CasB/Cse2
MTPTVEFISRLADLKEGERSRLRQLAGQPLNKMPQGFDLFAGLWWPLRAVNERTPPREMSWLVAKLHAMCSIPHIRPESGLGPSFSAVLGRCEPDDPPRCRARNSFRKRFDAVISSGSSVIEPRLHWGLREIAKAVAGRVPYAKDVTGIDWALLLDDLSLWNREFNMEDTWQKSRLSAHQRLAYCRETHCTPQDLWACEYLNATIQPEGVNHAD